MPALSYGEFGEAFIFTAVSPERVTATVKKIAGDSVVLGPIRAGPAGAATVLVRGTIGEPVAEEICAEPLTFSVTLPIDVRLRVRVGATSRFRGTGSIRLTLTARTVTPLALVIDVATVSPSDVHFDVEATGVQSRLLQRAGDVEGQMRAHAAAYVNEQTRRPDIARYTRIELLPLIEKTWADF